MHSDSTNQALLQAAQEFPVNSEQTIAKQQKSIDDAFAKQRKSIDDALEKIRVSSSLKDFDLGILSRNITAKVETSDFSPFDVVVEAQASHWALLAADLLKKIGKNGLTHLHWPENLYVYANYTPSFGFPPPPIKNLYAAERPGESSLGIHSTSSKNTGKLSLIAATHSLTLLGNVTIRAGIYVLFHATEETIGHIGGVTFSPKVTWETNHFHLALGQIGGKLSPLIINHEKTATSIELTVDRFNATTHQFVPLPNYQVKTYPINAFVPTYSELSRNESGVFRTGELRHSFLALPGQTYRLGIVTRLDLHWQITEDVARQLAGAMSNLYAGLEATVPSVVVHTVGFV